MANKEKYYSYILVFLLGSLVTIIYCRWATKDQIIREVEVPVETIVYVEKEPETKYSQEALAVARVLYGISGYSLNERQKTAVIEVILDRVADRAGGFRNYNTILDVCNQPSQWQGYDPEGSYLQEDYNLAIKVLNDTSGARVIPEGCYFVLVKHASVTVRTEFNGGNEWTV